MMGHPEMMHEYVEEMFLTAMDTIYSRPDVRATHRVVFQSILLSVLPNTL